MYFDYMQLAESKTISAPYVVPAYLRLGIEAPVATPLAWEEVRPGMEPGQFTLANAMDRFSRVGDLFAGVLKKPQSLWTRRSAGYARRFKAVNQPSTAGRQKS